MGKKVTLSSYFGPCWAVVLILSWGQSSAAKFEIVSHFQLNPPEIRAFEEGGANLNRLEVGPSGAVYVAFSGVLQGRRVTNVYFRRLLPAQDQWGALVQLSEEEILNRAPAIWVAPTGTIHYAWLADDNKKRGRVGFRYRKSDDDGISWSDVRKLDVGVVRPRVPVLRGDAQGNLYLCISNRGKREEQERIILFRSGDSGESWEQVDVHNGEERLVGASSPNLIAGEQGRAYLTWLDPSFGGRAVVFSQTGNGGKSWSNAIPLNDDLSRIFSNSVIELNDGQLQVTWVEAGGRRSSIYQDYSDDGGESWHSDELLYQEPVSAVILKSTQLRGKLLVSWEDYRNLLWQRGERLQYRLIPSEESAGGKDGAEQYSLTGDVDNLLAFHGFEVTPFGSDGCVAVYSKKTLNGLPKVYVSWSERLLEGFEEVLPVNQEGDSKENVWPRVRRLDDKELVILYNQMQPQRTMGQTKRRPLGDLILTRVRLQ